MEQCMSHNHKSGSPEVVPTSVRGIVTWLILKRFGHELKAMRRGRALSTVLLIEFVVYLRTGRKGHSAFSRVYYSVHVKGLCFLSTFAIGENNLKGLLIF